MRVLLALVAASFAGFFAVLIVNSIMPMSGIAALIVGFIPAYFVYRMIAGGTARGHGKTGWPADFNPDYQHDNIAIDTKSDRIWLRDRSSGKTVILKRLDMLRWTHRYTQGNGAWIKNFIDAEVRDLNRPKYEVSFNRHGDLWRWNAKKNAAECEEWQSRLTTWVNNSR